MQRNLRFIAKWGEFKQNMAKRLKFGLYLCRSQTAIAIAKAAAPPEAECSRSWTCLERAKAKLPERGKYGEWTEGDTETLTGYTNNI